MHGGGGGGVTNPLLDFQLRPLEARRNWKNVLNKQRYEATLRQQRDPTAQDDIGNEVTQALRRTIQKQINGDDRLTPHSTVHFTMQSNSFTHAFQSTTFSVKEFTDGSERLHTYLQALASKLNSNEEFTLDQSFTLETTFIYTPTPGRGHGKRYKPSSAAVRDIHKRSRITIKNKDDLCCARAIVTMKAYADANWNARDPDYHNLKQGLPVQERKAKDLHRLAGVTEGSCGIPELMQFQAALPGYQLKVISIQPPHMIIYVGPTSSSKIIRLIKDGTHYDGCNSFKGFMSKSYFCDECNRGYDKEDMAHHSCNGKWCKSCRRDNCSDFLTKKQTAGPGVFPTPTVKCQGCHREFFGQTCYENHILRTNNNKTPSVCDTYKTCPECRHTYTRQNPTKSDRPKISHRCGWGTCHNCLKEVQLSTHQCYIQPLPGSEDEPKFKKVELEHVSGRDFIPDDTEEAYVWVEREPPLQVYADYEALTDAEGNQTPIMICLEDDESDNTHVFYGPHCTAAMFDHLEEIAVDQDGYDRDVIVIFGRNQSPLSPI